MCRQALDSHLKHHRFSRISDIVDYLFNGQPSEYETDAELNECMDRIYGLAY